MDTNDQAHPDQSFEKDLEAAEKKLRMEEEKRVRDAKAEADAKPKTDGKGLNPDG